MPDLAREFFQRDVFVRHIENPVVATRAGPFAATATLVLAHGYILLLPLLLPTSCAALEVPQVRPFVDHKIGFALRLVSVLSHEGQEPTEEGSRMRLASRYSPNADAVLFHGDCTKLLSSIPRRVARLVITSPPYNVGKPYERRKLTIPEYISQQSAVIEQCVRILNPRGSLCWQVGSYVEKNRVLPLDILLYNEFASRGLTLRNRIIWHFGHGLHCRRRFSGRYETILWFTKGDDYLFNMDAVRVPQKYPGKRHYKGPNKGRYSSNPKGKNPGDVWLIPNVKNNHPEKTIHPCQFPVELVMRLILALTKKDDLVVDPFMGVGSTAAAAVLTGRRVAGAEMNGAYFRLAKTRVKQSSIGRLNIRPPDRPIYVPPAGSPLTTRRAE